MRLWAGAIAAGIPNEVFWKITPDELEEVLKIRMEEERRANLRAGLVAASIYNVNRRRGAALVYPKDFFRERPQEADFMEVGEAEKTLALWAATENLLYPPLLTDGTK